jgi:hypothetical protein
LRVDLVHDALGGGGHSIVGGCVHVLVE